MILAIHYIFTAYGFWLPNDPRGSWSDFVRAWELFRFGPATKVSTRRSLARDSHDHTRRTAAKAARRYPPVEFSGEQALAVGNGFKSAIARSGFVIHACSILPAHVHMVARRHRLNHRQVMNQMKGEATKSLERARLHPFQDFRLPSGRPHTPWTEKGWSVFLDSPADVNRAIRYVENNPAKEGKPPQHCHSPPHTIFSAAARGAFSMETPMPEPNRKPLIALAIAVVIFALVGASQMRHRELDWTAIWAHAASVTLYLNAYGLPFLLLAGTLIARGKSVSWALAVAAGGMSFAVASAVTPFLETVFYQVHPPLFLRITSLSSVGFGCILITLLLSHRLRGRLDGLRLAACGLFAAVLTLHVLSYVPHMGWVFTLPAECCRAVAGAVCFFAVSFLAWCLAFRQAVPNRPPIDSAPVVSLTCPRCHTPQQIASGHGQCTHCRLDITISLNEGVCLACGHPLRGLTGEKCPECGTPIIPPDPNAHLAPVHADDEHHGT